MLVEQRDADTVGQIRMSSRYLTTLDQSLPTPPAIPCSSAVPARSRMRASIRATALSSIRPSASPSKRCPPRATRNLALEETPDVTFADIGGLDSEIGRIRDAVQLPFQHRALFERYDLKPPKGVLLYGPPGNGKTMIAKAVANALCEGGYDTNGDGSISPAETHVKGVFLSVKGPELLNKYVGESERLIRLILPACP